MMIMREILFRGKRKDNGEWVYGNLLMNEEKSHILVPPKKTQGKISFEPFVSYAVIPVTVSQHTGLLDKNGTRIFEGDILREPAKIEWEKTNFVGYEVFWHDNDSCDRHIGWQMNRLHFYGALCGAEIYPISFRPEWTSKMEVIGNIYDNPKLLEGSR